MPVRVLIADDDALVAQGFASRLALEPDLDVVACNSLTSIMNLLDDKDGAKVDVMLIDLRWHGVKRFDFIEQIRKGFPRIKIVLWTGYPELSDIKKSDDLGCTGYVEKICSAAQTTDAIRKVFNGNLVRFGNISKQAVALPELGQQQKKIFCLFMEGLPAKKIGDLCGLTEIRIHQVVQELLLLFDETDRDELIKKMAPFRSYYCQAIPVASDHSPGQTPPTKIFIVDDQSIWIDSLVALFESENTDKKRFQFVGRAENGRIALERLEYIQADLLLIDVVMPIMNGIETSKIVRQKYPEMKIIVFSSDTDRYKMIHALNAGVNGYMSKNRSKEDLLNIVENVMAGKCVIAADWHEQDGPKMPPPPLSDRELKIACLLIENVDKEKIAELLKINVRMVDKTVIELKKKFASNNNSANPGLGEHGVDAPITTRELKVRIRDSGLCNT